ncbi:MAG TPA: amino acid permease [Firmicutes bacterium]|nr:amino acid permease [Candidatus Fermentithermobacillaceae bacterium]
MFLGAGTTVSTAGPAVVLAYTLGGAVMFAVMLALGEMTVERPAPGAFRVHAREALGPYFGFIAGWMYYFSWLGTMSAEIVAATTYLTRWIPPRVAPFFGLLLVIILMAVNLTKVESFGTFEFWFAMVKVVAIGAFILFGAAVILGYPGHPGLGTKYLTGAGGFFPTGFSGVVRAMAMVMVAYGGTEVIGVAAGETKDPASSVPRAVRGVALRTLILYVGAMMVLVAVIPWYETSLKESPFVLVYDMLGIPWAPDIMNLVVLTAALSSLNCGLYTSSRMLYSLAQETPTLRALSKVSPRSQVPYLAVIASSISVYAAITLYWLAPTGAFLYVTSITSFGFLFVWLVICLSHIRWRYVVSDRSAFKAPLYPWLSLVSAALLASFMFTLTLIREQRVGIYAGLIVLSALSAAYGLELLGTVPALKRLIPRAFPKPAHAPVTTTTTATATTATATTAAAAASFGLLIAKYFGFVSEGAPEA